MPIYEYRCAQCGHQFEKLIRNRAEIPDACPECGAEGLKKLFSTFSPGAASSSHRDSACADGACPLGPSGPAGTCPTGSCPF
ncbi:MAG: zinc ribbon domain-containing protein [Kiritimatiellaeota bacterium]|nr:zinc ribbon domain-containing protein [Kiritimatiellota bacterium]